MEKLAKIPVAVVGVGYAGRYHAEKYAASKKARLEAVGDIDRDRATEVGKKLRGAALTDYRDLFGRGRCVSIVVPTRLHYQVARGFFTPGVGCFVGEPQNPAIEEGK